MKKVIMAYRLKGVGLNKKGPLESMVSEEHHQYSNVYQINFLCPKFKITGRFKQYDYIQSYDGYDIVSQRFRNFCIENRYEQIDFIAFPNSPGFFWLKVHNLVQFDAVKKGTRFIGYSKKYNGYKEVIGASPVILKTEAEIFDGIYRTDLFFADGESKHPLLIVGVTTKEKMKSSGLRGLIFEEIR